MISTKIKKVKEPKSPIETRLIEYKKIGHNIVPTKSTKLWAHIASNMKPPVLDIWLMGPDDVGRCKDIHIDVRSLVAELKRVKVI